MREILFRGKTYESEWVQGDLYHRNKEVLINNFHEGFNLRVIPETVGQYTGKDICNQKLFEGDIVEWYEDYDDSFGYSKTANGYSVVVWDNENYCWSFKTDNDYIQPFNDWNWENCFIISNIHDNPELLESEVQGE